MTAGGARTRSGPAPDPKSGRSDRRGLTFRPLPSEGYDGEIPEFPSDNPGARVLHWWRWAWRTPQAAAWVTSRESWRIPAVAEWCTVKADLENEGAPTGLWAAKFRLEDRIMFSTAGLIESGYQVVVDELAGPRADVEVAPSSSRSRLKVVSSDGR